MTRKCHPFAMLLSSLLLLGIASVCNGGDRDMPTTRYDSIILRQSKIHKIHPLLIKAVIWRESHFKPLSVGQAGEIGLMQISADAARDWSKEHHVRTPRRSEMFNPSINIAIGTWYLARARNHWKSHRQAHVLALCEYNAGRTGMKRKVLIRYNGRIGISDQALRYYVNTIVKQYNHYLYVANVESSRKMQVSRNP